ncbi:MAG: response regulator [Sandaracinaceae bacterium]|nr:response regulator [Sandaracinaceae bacterium]
MTDTIRVLLAEDDSELRPTLVEILEKAGFEVIDVSDGLAVQAYADDCFVYDKPHRRVHVLVSDIRMPGLNGLRLLEHVRDLGWDVPTVLITAFGDAETRALAKELGAYRVLDKPFSPEALQECVRDAYQAAR